MMYDEWTLLDSISFVSGLLLLVLFCLYMGAGFAHTIEESTPPCPEPILIGLSTPPTDYEKQIIRGAKIKCGYLYDGACLKKLEQARPRGFKATCRRERK